MQRLLTLRSWAPALTSTLLLAVSAAADTVEEPVRTFPLESGGYLSLENVNGNVTIEGWKKNEVSVRVTKRGEKKNIDRVQVTISVDEWDGKEWIHIETEYPSFFGTSASVEYEIQAPSDATLEDIELVSGDLTVTGITGYLSLGTVNGSITASGAANSAWVETVNGKLDLSFDKMDEGQTVDLETVNGAILLKIPAKSNARIEAETVNGGISNDFGVTVEKGEWIGSSCEGTVGDGGARIALETVNGTIEVKKN